jgi:Holliday junction resolvase RusA-like endonuclease
LSLEVVIPGDPVPQGRPRFGGMRNGKVRVYNPEAARIWRAVAALHYHRALVDARHERPMFREGLPLRVHVLAVFPCPSSYHRKRTPLPTLPYVAQENDGDNLAKAVMDAGNGILWNDDGQVSLLVVERWRAAQGEEPFVRVTVEEWTPAERGAA